jgi:hypothetical protein
MGSIPDALFSAVLENLSAGTRGSVPDYLLKPANTDHRGTP